MVSCCITDNWLKSAVTSVSATETDAIHLMISKFSQTEKLQRHFNKGPHHKYAQYMIYKCNCLYIVTGTRTEAWLIHSSTLSIALVIVNCFNGHHQKVPRRIASTIILYFTGILWSMQTLKSYNVTPYFGVPDLRSKFRI